MNADGRRFPIQSKDIESIPWDMIAPHEAQAVRNHSQTLQRLADRGGLFPYEAILVLDGRRWDGKMFVLPSQRAESELFEKLAAEDLWRRVVEFEESKLPASNGE